MSWRDKRRSPKFCACERPAKLRERVRKCGRRAYRYYCTIRHAADVVPSVPRIYIRRRRLVSTPHGKGYRRVYERVLS